MNQQPSQIAVPSLADAQQGRLATSRVFARHKSEPCCHIPSPLELPTIACSCNDRRRRQRPNSRHRHQSACTIILRGDRFDLARHFGDAAFQVLQILEEICEEPTHHWRKVVLLIGQDPREVGFELADTLMDRDAIFEAEGAHLTDQARAVGHHLVADPMQCLQIDLSAVFTSTKRIVGRVTASAIAAASIVSFLFDFT